MTPISANNSLIVFGSSLKKCFFQHKGNIKLSDRDGLFKKADLNFQLKIFFAFFIKSWSHGSLTFLFCGSDPEKFGNHCSNVGVSIRV